MSWWVAAIVMASVVCLAAVGRGWITKARDALKPLPDDGTRRCPHCGHAFERTRRWCLACGGQIWDEVLSRHR